MNKSQIRKMLSELHPEDAAELLGEVKQSHAKKLEDRGKELWDELTAVNKEYQAAAGKPLALPPFRPLGKAFIEKPASRGRTRKGEEWYDDAVISFLRRSTDGEATAREICDGIAEAGGSPHTVQQQVFKRLLESKKIERPSRGTYRLPRSG